MAVHARTICFAVLALGSAGPAAADGEFLQVDAATQNQSAVATVARGPLSYGLNFTNYETGQSASASLTYALPLNAPVTVRLGPTVGYERDDSSSSEVEGGIRVAAERYIPAGFGSVYLLSDVSTVHRSWFVLGQLTYAPANIAVELSRGGSETYRETTLAFNKRLNGSPVSLRLGYKISSKEVFAGFSINTF